MTDSLRPVNREGHIRATEVSESTYTFTSHESSDVRIHPSFINTCTKVTRYDYGFSKPSPRVFFIPAIVHPFSNEDRFESWPQKSIRQCPLGPTCVDASIADVTVALRSWWETQWLSTRGGGDLDTGPLRYGWLTPAWKKSHKRSEDRFESWPQKSIHQ